MKRTLTAALLLIAPYWAFSQTTEPSSNGNFLPVQFFQSQNKSYKLNPDVVKQYQEKGLDLHKDFGVDLEAYGYFRYYDKGQLTYLLDTVGNMRQIPSNQSLIAVLKNGSLIIADKPIEGQEVLKYGNIRIVDKNNKPVLSKSILKSYIVNVSVAGIQSADYNGNTYVKVFNPATSKDNIIDNTGSLIFKQDYYSLSFLFDDFVLTEDKYEGDKIVYQIGTKKSINLNEYMFMGVLDQHKLVKLIRKSDKKHCLYDLAAGKVVLEGENEMSTIEQNDGTTVKDFFLIRSSSDNYGSNNKVIDRTGNVVIPVEGRRFIFNADNTVTVYDKADKHNIFDIAGKKFLYPGFVSDVKETDDFKLIKVDKFYTVLEKKTNKQIYSEADMVTGYKQYGNMYLIDKEHPEKKSMMFADVYSVAKGEVVFKDIRTINRINNSSSSSFTSDYFTITTQSSDYIAVDKDGNTVMPQRYINWKIQYNGANNTLEIIDKKGKVLETIKITPKG